MARRGQERPGEARGGQEWPGEARSGQERPGEAMGRRKGELADHPNRFWTDSDPIRDRDELGFKYIVIRCLGFRVGDPGRPREAPGGHRC